MRIVKLKNGKQIDAYLGDDSFMQHLIETNSDNTVSFISEEEASTELPISQSWEITKFAFKNRFPREKWKAAKALASVDADIADFFEDIDFAKYIDLKYQPLVDGINGLGLESVPENIRLTEAEIDAILNVPCQPGEEV